MKASSSSTEACVLGVAENSRNDNGLYARCLMSACRRVSGIRMCRVWYIIEGRSWSRSSLMKQKSRILIRDDDVVRTSHLPKLSDASSKPPLPLDGQRLLFNRLYPRRESGSSIAYPTTQFLKHRHRKYNAHSNSTSQTWAISVVVMNATYAARPSPSQYPQSDRSHRSKL